MTYTPSHDRILPTPPQFYVKVKNSSATALRAAYLHGPYTLYASCCPATFNPNSKHDGSDVFGNPQFESHIKAGGSWNATLRIPEEIRQTLATSQQREGIEGSAPSVTWIIEIASQILFSPTANIHYEVIVGRDEKSIDFGFGGLIGGSTSIPGQLADHQHNRRHKSATTQPRGLYSRSITLIVDDTASLWNKPELPEWKDDQNDGAGRSANPVLADSNPRTARPEQDPSEPSKYIENPRKRKRRKVHLVVITHGLHSNLGADMLYMKESIDVAAKEALLDAKMRKAKNRASSSASRQSASDPSSQENNESGAESTSNSAQGASKRNAEDHEEDSEDEEVIVRGFAGNVTKTEKGIQYLGKRLAKYVLSITYPDQPYLPLKKAKSPLAKAFSGNNSSESGNHPSHSGSSISREDAPTSNLPYQITSISFIGHSLGGLTQTYAIAYIYKHSPEFFERIKPVNFIALATPFLGLSNENPIFIKAALDFGLVGRTGQDLGLTWRAPTIARSGWSAMIAGIGTEGQREKRQLNPGSKPLLRILPAGPAHQVLRLFRNRTVYSNVVNDGVVPLRTSCLLFLDWRGLGRVEKARRENGLVGAVANWGWAELTGTNTSEHQKFKFWFDNDLLSNSEASGDEGSLTPNTQATGNQVPQPAENATLEDSGVVDPESPVAQQFLRRHSKSFEDEDQGANKPNISSASQSTSPLSGFLNFFKPGNKSPQHPPKQKKIYRRGQTMMVSDGAPEGESSESTPELRPGMARGESALNDPDNLFSPPTTSVFESATDIMNPPIPSLEYLNDPTSRPRTIFHDRIYHPEDIPPPPIKKRSTLRRNHSGEGRDPIPSRNSTLSNSSSSSTITTTTEIGSMKVEEKIARAYHRDLSWRKVLVRLEPDAHNNIVVRRKFANAYGWPVVKHLVDTHFADSYAAKTDDSLEPNTERAEPMDRPVGEHGEEVKEKPKPRRASTGSTGHPEARDGLADLTLLSPNSKHSNSYRRPRINRTDSAQWDDRFFTSESEDEDEEFDAPRSPKQIPVDQSRKGNVPEIVKGKGKETVKENPTAPTTTDGELGIDTQAVQGLVLPNITSSPKSTANVGLGKTVEEQLDMVTKARKADEEQRK